MSLKISDIGEKQLIKYILSISPDIVPDDSAIVNYANNNLISTCDMLIESKHFPENMSYYQMGFKSVTVNVSDLAAMGAEPLGFLLSMALPKDLEFSSFKEIINGVLSACKYYGMPLIGGDTNEASEIILSGTALGVCDNPMMKNKYDEGDLICLTGDVGLAALGFNLDYDSIYTDKALNPKARLTEGIILKNSGISSATDITDGLASELYEIKKENYGFMIYEDKLNISDEYKRISSNLDFNYLDLIFHIGEDFELLFLMDENVKLDIDYKVIGEVNNSNKVELKLLDGNVVEIKNEGYNHLC